MRLSQVVLLLAGWLPLALPAADEAAILAEIRQLQADPDPQRRAWLESLLAYQPRQTKNLLESRERIDVPRYPIAGAARTALRELAIRERADELQAGHAPRSIPGPGDELELAAWCQWLRREAGLPAALTQLAAPETWPEPLLRCAATHAPTSALVTALTLRAEEGASLRWLDQQLPELTPGQLHLATNNPALASAAWREWARRANAGDLQAARRLTQASAETAELPGAAVGLSTWQGGVTLARSLLEHPADNVRRRARLTLILAGADGATRAQLLREARP